MDWQPSQHESSGCLGRWTSLGAWAVMGALHLAAAPVTQWRAKCMHAAAAPYVGFPPASRCSPQIMHVLVALAMWQLHLGADADHRRFSALLDGSLSCPGLVAAASLS